MKLISSQTEFDVLENSAVGIDSDGWALICPFGSFPKTRIFRDGNGIKEQKFIQVLNNEAADAILAQENSLFGKIKRAIIGLPIYKGHGDLNDFDKTALGNSAEKIKLGTVDQVRKSDRGLEAHFILDNDGAEAVGGGWKFPSVLWSALHTGQQGDSILCTPFKLLSVALTQFPNISGVDSLANARTFPSVEQHPDSKKNPLKEQIIGVLIGRGVVLPNDVTDFQIISVIAKGDFMSATNFTTCPRCRPVD
jgi:hypothetical protein